MGNESSGTSSLKSNSVISNRYKIHSIIGSGGMGTVYLARDLNFTDVKRLVAVKEMQTATKDAAMRGSMIKNFRREANLLAQLNHSAIPRIFDIFEINDRAYLVMEYINGTDLEQLMQKTKELPIEKVLEWAIDLCDVLDYLHNQTPDPIIFRDMKPSNVMIDSQGKVRLIDFGIARTFVHHVKGTMIDSSPAWAVCIPKLTRLKPTSPSSRAYSTVISFGFASNVISASCCKSKLSRTASNRVLNCAACNKLGVPPPKKMLCTRRRLSR